MLVLSIISTLIFTAYVIVCAVKFEPQPSLSNTYYMWEERKKGLGILFYLVLTTVVFTIVAPVVEISGGWGFLTAASLGFVGAAPEFKDKLSLDSVIHPTAAGISALGAFITIFCMHDVVAWMVTLGVILIVVIAALCTRTLRRSHTWWLEMIAFYSLFTNVIVWYIK